MTDLSSLIERASFTPGPWSAEEGTLHHSNYIVITADHVGMRPNTPLARLGSSFDDTAWNDARLIAACPDLVEALAWYAEQVAGCRKITPEGDAARQALDADGGKRAKAALLRALSNGSKEGA